MNELLPADALGRLSASDPVIAAIIARVGAFEPRRGRANFETLVQAIVSQQISVAAAASIGARVRALAGGEELTPEHIIAVSTEELRTAGLSAAKSRYVRDLAEKTASGIVDLPSLPGLPDEEVIAHLIAVKGIGRWTAEMFLIFSLLRLDVLPVDDLGLRAAVRRSYGLDALPGKSMVAEIGEKWRPYRSVATWYLWQSLRVAPIE